jgi:hypothetical protein
MRRDGELAIVSTIRIALIAASPLASDDPTDPTPRTDGAVSSSNFNFGCSTARATHRPHTNDRGYTPCPGEVSEVGNAIREEESGDEDQSRWRRDEGHGEMRRHDLDEGSSMRAAQCHCSTRDQPMPDPTQADLKSIESTRTHGENDETTR